MSPPVAKSPYAGHRFPAEVIRSAVWLYFRFPLSLPMEAVAESPDAMMSAGGSGVVAT